MHILRLIIYLNAALNAVILIDVRSVIGFSDTYTRMAINGLERILYDIKKDPSYTPNERLVMWY